MRPISFGKKKALLINPRCNDKNIKKRHTDIINHLRNYKSVRIWENNHNKTNVLQNIVKKPYLIHPIIQKRTYNNKMENVKEYFLLLSNIHNKKICFFIEKKKPLSLSYIYQTRIRFDETLFGKTLFTGYLTISEKEDKKNTEKASVVRIFGEIFSSIKKEVNSFKRNKNWLFVITDILSREYISYSLVHRINIIKNILGRYLFSDSRIDVCDFELIYYKNYNSIQHFLLHETKYINYLISEHNVVFVSVNNAPCTNNYTISLTKKINKNNYSSIDKKISFKNGEWKVINIVNENKKSKKNKLMYLKLSNYSDVYWVYDTNWKKCGIARIKTLEESEYIRNLFNNNNEHIKIKCKWNSEFNKWQPII